MLSEASVEGLPASPLKNCFICFIELRGSSSGFQLNAAEIYLGPTSGRAWSYSDAVGDRGH